MIQRNFIDQVVDTVRKDRNVLGLAVAGSFITNEVDEYSDVDLILVTVEKVSADVGKMMDYAKSFGDFLNGFTGDHVGEKRLLICLYDKPLLHVDIKFLTPGELAERVEDPIIYWDPQKILEKMIHETKPRWPAPDYQWIEDRFWTWLHYAALKLGRGENFEALEFLSFIRTTVISPLLQIKNGQLPRGMRKVEFNFQRDDLNRLVQTVPKYDVRSIFEAVDHTVLMYQELRGQLYPATVSLRTNVEKKTLAYFEAVRHRKQAERY